MSTKKCGSLLLARGTLRRGFSTTSRRLDIKGAAPSGYAPKRSSGWTGGGVLAIATTAGAVGWGLATWGPKKKDQDPSRPQAKATNKQVIGYATLPEMERVRTGLNPP